MKNSSLIEEIAENIKDLPIPFSYLESLKNYNAGIQKENLSPDNIAISNFKPMRIDKYQTSNYMKLGGYFKPISRFYVAKKRNTET